MVRPQRPDRHRRPQSCDDRRRVQGRFGSRGACPDAMGGPDGRHPAGGVSQRGDDRLDGGETAGTRGAGLVRRLVDRGQGRRTRTSRATAFPVDGDHRPEAIPAGLPASGRSDITPGSWLRGADPVRGRAGPRPALLRCPRRGPRLRARVGRCRRRHRGGSTPSTGGVARRQLLSGSGHRRSCCRDDRPLRPSHRHRDHRARADRELPSPATGHRGMWIGPSLG